eukprot:4437462-Pleurochrysis_carterae.AAC.2
MPIVSLFVKQQHNYPTTAVKNYTDMIKYCEENVSCILKSFNDMCALAYFSPGVARGQTFTPFRCICCGYACSEEEWPPELREHECLSNAERRSPSLSTTRSERASTNGHSTTTRSSSRRRLSTSAQSTQVLF